MSIIPDILRDCQILVTVPGDGTEPFPNVPTTDRERLLGRTHSTIGAVLPNGQLYRIEHSARLGSNENRPISTEVYGPVRQAFLDNLVPGLADERQIVDAERRDYEQYQKFVAHRNKRKQDSDKTQADETARLLRQRDQSMRLAAIALEAEQARVHEEQARKRQRGAAAWAQVNAERAAEEANLRLERARRETSREQLEAESAKLAEEKARSEQEKAKEIADAMAELQRQAAEKLAEESKLEEQANKLLEIDRKKLIENLAILRQILVDVKELQEIYKADPNPNQTSVDAAEKIISKVGDEKILEETESLVARINKRRAIFSEPPITIVSDVDDIRGIKKGAERFVKQISAFREINSIGKNTELLDRLLLQNLVTATNLRLQNTPESRGLIKNSFQTGKAQFDEIVTNLKKMRTLNLIIRNQDAEEFISKTETSSKGTFDALQKLFEESQEEAAKKRETTATVFRPQAPEESKNAVTVLGTQATEEENESDDELDAAALQQQFQAKYNLRKRNQ